METTKNENLYYTLNEAHEKALSVGINVTYITMLSWVEKNKLGFQPGGVGSRWFVYKDKFDNFVHGRLEKNHAKKG